MSDISSVISEHLRSVPKMNNAELRWFIVKQN